MESSHLPVPNPEAVPRVVPICDAFPKGFLPEDTGPDALTPNTVELIPTLGALSPQGGPVQDPVPQGGFGIVCGWWASAGGVLNVFHLDSEMYWNRPVGENPRTDEKISGDYR